MVKLIRVCFNFKVKPDPKYENCRNFEATGTFLDNGTCKVDNNTYVKYNIPIICDNGATNQN